MKVVANTEFSFQKLIVYSVIVSGLLGTAFFNIDLGLFSLSPYRLVLLCAAMYMVMQIRNINFYRFAHVHLSILFLCLWLCFSLSGVMWSFDKLLAFKNVVYIFFNLLTVIVLVYFLQTTELIYLVLKCWLFIYVLFAFFAIYEVFSGSHLANSMLNGLPPEMSYLQFVPTVTFGNQNDYATFMTLSLPFISIVALNTDLKYFKWGLTFIYLISLPILFATTSRANYLGLFVSFTISFLFFTNLRSKFAVILLVVFLVGGTYLLLPTDLLEQFWVYVETFQGITAFNVDEDLSLEVRWNLVYNSFYFFITSFGLGVGPGNLEAYNKFKSPTFTDGIINSHNWWFEIMANYGILIFALYVLMYLWILYTLFTIRFQASNKKTKVVSEFLLAGFLTFIVSSSSPSSVIAFIPQWIFLGIALSFINVYKRDSSLASAVA